MRSARAASLPLLDVSLEPRLELEPVLEELSLDAFAEVLPDVLPEDMSDDVEPVVPENDEVEPGLVEALEPLPMSDDVDAVPEDIAPVPAAVLPVSLGAAVVALDA